VLGVKSEGTSCRFLAVTGEVVKADVVLKLSGPGYNRGQLVGKSLRRIKSEGRLSNLGVVSHSPHSAQS